MNFQEKLSKELETKELFEQAKTYAYAYSDEVKDREVYPNEEALEGMRAFDESLPEKMGQASKILEQLDQYGSPATVAHTGGRYFGFVLGGAIPISIATKWLSDFWDQCGGLYLTSPINAKLEAICEQWLKELFGLPESTVAGFVSGTSMANLCGLTAARYRLLKNQGWDVNTKGLYGAPPLRIIAHRQVHSSIRKTLAMLGFGHENVEWIPADDQGRMLLDQLPELDNRCMVLLQAGNVNSGAFDSFEPICQKANEAGAWVHIDGAFGLWAKASASLAHLTKGMELAHSWAVDGHKTLNTPYDSGIVLCKDAEAFVTSLQATGEYIIYSEERDPMMYTPEMSKRSRAIELWATMKYLGREGMDEMVTGFHLRSKQLEKGLLANGFRILNEVVFNQVLVACQNEALTKKTLENIQQAGACWCGGSSWAGESVIRMSICSWATTEEDIERTLAAFVEARRAAMEIDKLAYIEIQNGQILTTRSKGKSVYYIPGGKRDKGESDSEALIREVKEELTVDLLPDSIKYVGTFTAQAHGHADGVDVKMTCYAAAYQGELSASSEIAEIKWLNYSYMDEISPVDKLIFEYLKKEGQLE